MFSHRCKSGFLTNSLYFPGEAHTKSQMVKAELELEVNKLRAEEAALRDSLHKMQALNEGLGQDKIELNKIIMQVCIDNIF